MCIHVAIAVLKCMLIMTALPSENGLAFGSDHYDHGGCLMSQFTVAPPSQEPKEEAARIVTRLVGYKGANEYYRNRS